MGKMSRTKGKNGELEAAHKLTEVLGIEAARGRQYQGSDESPDLKTSLAGVHFEVKRTESMSLYKAMLQAETDCGDAVPVVLHRRNKTPWVVVVKLDDLPKFCTQVYLQLSSR